MTGTASYVASKLVTALISPLGTALFLGLLALCLGFCRRRRWAIALGTTGLIWLWLWSMPLASEALRAQMESAYPPMTLQSIPSAPAIVVLGGGVAPPVLGRPWPDLGGAADRVWHAARLYHAGKAPLVLLSGGSDPEVSLSSEAEAMRSFLLDLGVPDQAMILEENSRSTQENARFSTLLLRRRGIDKVLLVTSALHMERARREFEAAGLTVMPVATDHSASSPVTRTSWMDLLPDAGALAGSAPALKEWVGQRMLPHTK